MQIDQFWSHLNHATRPKGLWLDAGTLVAETEKLSEKSLPLGNVPVWIQREEDLSAKEILNFIKSNSYIGPSQKVTIVVNNHYNPSDLESALEWATEENERGKCARIAVVSEETAMRGCEDDALIYFQVLGHRNEIYTRARETFIIISTKG